MSTAPPPTEPPATPTTATTVVADPPPMHEHRVVLEAGWADRHYWRDLWRYRELLMILAWRDVSVRYRQTVVGLAWAGIRPLLQMTILVVLFGRVARLPSGGIPYPVLVLSGMIPWQLFTNSLGAASGSLVGSASLVSKVYFPRLIVPLSSLASGLTDVVVTLPLLFVVMAWYGVTPPWQVVFLPVAMAAAVLSALALGLWVAAMNVRYRDIGFIVPFVIQFGMYLTPVAYSATAVRDRVPDEYWWWLYQLNPAVGVVEGFRWCLVGDTRVLSAAGQAAAAAAGVGPTVAAGGTAPGLGLTPISAASTTLWTAGMLYFGLRYFRRAERSFADVI